MPRPLYALNLTDQEKRAFETSGNRGLWNDKFCDIYPLDFSRPNEKDKKAWLNALTREAAGDRHQLAEFAERLTKLCEAQKGLHRIVWNHGSLVHGTGRSHPLENGFSFHPTLGTPYLSGASLKGLTRTWAEDWAGADKDTIRRIFGPKSQEALAVGSVIFLDAVPTEPIRLTVEVMTPHYQDYYQNGADPGDWHSPVPIQFLAVAPGGRFWIGVMPRRPHDPQSQEDAAKAMAWLEEALEELGAGAKTATGFGRMSKMEITGRIPPASPSQGQASRRPANGPVGSASASVRQSDPEPEALSPLAAALLKAQEEKARRNNRK